MKIVGHRAFSLVIAGVCILSTGLIGAAGASANTDGQYGFTGRTGSCLECHGANQYAGLSLTVSPALADTLDCWVNDEDASTADNPVLKKLELPIMAFNQTVDMAISITDPGDQAACPADDCCDCEGAACADREICGEADGFFIDGVYRQQGECINFLNDCDIDDVAGDDPVAGFNIEVVGGGIFAAQAGDDTVRVRENGGEVIPTEVTHYAPRYFEADSITWNLNFTAPAEADYEDALSFWVGANVANGNGRADANDLNSNYQLTVALGDRVPTFCAVCDDDGTLPDDSGNCSPGCSHTGVPANAVPVGALALGFLGLAFRRRRR